MEASYFVSFTTLLICQRLGETRIESTHLVLMAYELFFVINVVTPF